ncbi:DUF2917 domain-containing protein [Geobacter sp. FeAm09]|uniref:DUF2917 domain-containing protein n=1 Tax=Geobacter sp. FeAm09 TaxID=2597769 RepID=UPI00143D1691|nr:DUF2917 domain-containing protein [Geobacter sp. FeAm09]
MECYLAEGELVRLNGGPSGLRVRCSSGTVWLTRGDAADYIIAVGDYFDVAAGQVALVEALKPAEIRLGELPMAGGYPTKPPSVWRPADHDGPDVSEMTAMPSGVVNFRRCDMAWMRQRSAPVGALFLVFSK